MSFITPGEILKKIREQLNVTQNELMDAGISRNFISMFESGKRKLNKETASRIIHVLEGIAIKKGMQLEYDTEYLYVSSEDAAQAYCYDKLNNIQDELDINEVISLCKDYKFEQILCQATIVKANIIYNNTKYKEAFYCYQEALEMSIRLRDNFKLSLLYNKLGKCKLDLLSYEESIIFFQKSYQYATLYEDIICKKNSLFNMALAYKKLGMIDDALINIDKFISMRNKEKFVDDYINAIILKANCCIVKSDYSEALNLYKDIESMILDKQNPLLGYIYNNIGVVYLDLDEISDSLFYFEKAEEIRRKVDKSNFAYTLIDKSQVYVKKGLFDEAVELLESGIQIAGDFNDAFCIIKACLLLEKLYLSKNDLKKLEDIYIRMLETLKSTEDNNQINIILNKLSLLNINKGNIEKSKMYLEAAIKMRSVTP